MKFIELIDGAFEIRWTWLPFWLATNPKLKTSLEGEMKALIALNGVQDSEEDLAMLHRHVVKRLQEMFPEMRGLDVFLDGLRAVQPS